jgi:hypothetical protein
VNRDRACAVGLTLRQGTAVDGDEQGKNQQDLARKGNHGMSLSEGRNECYPRTEDQSAASERNRSDPTLGR